MARYTKSSATKSKAKAIVVAFGRFQPPTSGHQLLADKVMEYAKRMGTAHAMFSSRTNDEDRNPLPPNRKFHYLKKFFPDANFIDNKSIKTPVDMLKYLADRGYTKVYMVSGEDRFEEYKRFRKFIKPGKKERIPLDSLDFLEAGKRDPDAEGVKGMSGSKLRAAIKAGDFNGFASSLPRGANATDAKALYGELRSGLGVKEGKDYSNVYRCAAMRLLESDKFKRRPPTPGQTGGFSKHNKKFPTPPCAIDEDLARWFKEKWVDISRKGKDGGYAPCGRSDASKGAYPKCRPLQGGNTQGTGNAPLRGSREYKEV